MATPTTAHPGQRASADCKLQSPQAVPGGCAFNIQSTVSPGGGSLLYHPQVKRVSQTTLILEIVL